MDSNPVVVDCNTPIDTVSTIITDDDDVDIFREFIVTQKQQFLGVASVRDLLKRITELRIQNARYANPLTLLPGNVPIHQHLDELLAARQSFAIAYFDINHFKPFNDNYGYAKGDEVIRQLGQLLVQYADSPYTFIGHIGGDDFVVIFRKTEVAEVICKQVIDAFEQHITTFYSTQDKQRGYVLATGRNGQQQSFPLTSLAVGLVIVSADTIQSHHQVAALASDAKKQAKQESGSYCYVDCR
jgi:diguanylate cyclase (GGDEF)-like protein